MERKYVVISRAKGKFEGFGCFQEFDNMRDAIRKAKEVAPTTLMLSHFEGAFGTLEWTFLKNYYPKEV